MSFREDPLEDFAEDEAEQLWGGGPTELRDAKARHIPFYKFTYYADRLDLRHAGYELEKFESLFDLLDEARVSQAIKVNRLLHLPSGPTPGGNPVWQPRKAREIEFRVIESLYRFGLSIVPNRLRRVLGKAFNEGEMSAFDVDLIDVFYWASLAQVARDFIWRDSRLEEWAEYLEYPVRRTFGQTAAAA